MVGENDRTVAVAAIVAVEVGRDLHITTTVVGTGGGGRGAEETGEKEE